jgi:hypothetical protein
MTKVKKRVGRPMKSPQSEARVQLSFRVSAEVKRRLDEAANRNDRSQSQEAEIRLERTLLEEDQFGGPELLNMARLMAAAFLRGGRTAARSSNHPNWTARRWIEDPWCYIAACQAVSDALALAQPAHLKFKEGVSPEQQATARKVFDYFARYESRRALAEDLEEGEKS